MKDNQMMKKVLLGVGGAVVAGAAVVGTVLFGKKHNQEIEDAEVIETEEVIENDKKGKK